MTGQPRARGAPLAALRPPKASRRWLFRLVALALTLLLAEGGLALLRLVSPRVDYHLSPAWTRITRADPVLGHRPSPFYPEHDARGFRNPATLDACDVLAVGDSMTYGYAAAPAEAWPRQLERALGRPVCSMAFGAYGPCEYRALVAEGLRLRPRVVVVGLFPSNDLVDCWETVYLGGRCRDLASTDPVTRAAILAAEAQDPMRAHHDRLLGWREPEPQPTLGAWASEHSALFGLLRALRGLAAPDSSFRGAGQAQDGFAVAAARPNRVALAGPDPTVFLPPAALGQKLDLADPRIAEGERIARSALGAIADGVKEGGAVLLVLVVPSKQRVYAERLPEGPLRELVAGEEHLTASLCAFLREREVEVIDATAALRRALAQGERPYWESDDEHPRGAGYAAIARAVQGAVEREIGKGR